MSILDWLSLKFRFNHNKCFRVPLVEVIKTILCLLKIQQEEHYIFFLVISDQNSRRKVGKSCKILLVLKEDFFVINSAMHILDTIRALSHNLTVKNLVEKEFEL